MLTDGNVGAARLNDDEGWIGAWREAEHEHEACRRHGSWVGIIPHCGAGAERRAAVPAGHQSMREADGLHEPGCASRFFDYRQR